MGAPVSAAATPAWLGAWQLVQDATFTFLGSPMPVVDDVDIRPLCSPRRHYARARRGAEQGKGDQRQQQSRRQRGHRGGGVRLRPRQRRREQQQHAGLDELVVGQGTVGSRLAPRKAPRAPRRRQRLEGNVHADKGTVAAVIVETPFPAERLLRSLVNAGKDDEVLYIDVIVADRYGAAYRLLKHHRARRQGRSRGGWWSC